GLEMEAVHLPQQEGQFDLDLMMVEEAETISGPIKYRSDLFDRETIERMAEHLTILIDGAIKDPDAPIGELPLLSERERRRILVEWNDTNKDYPVHCVHHLFE